MILEQDLSSVEQMTYSILSSQNDDLFDDSDSPSSEPDVAYAELRQNQIQSQITPRSATGGVESIKTSNTITVVVREAQWPLYQQSKG